MTAIFLIDIYPLRLTCDCTHRILLAVVLAIWVVPTIPLIGIILVVSCLSSHPSRHMAQHPTVSDSLRGVLTF